jgi:hypothetical protein
VPFNGRKTPAPVPRRDFMKVFGGSLGSLILTRFGIFLTLSGCRSVSTCYTVVPSQRPGTGSTATPTGSRAGLRLCWLRLGELAEKTHASWESTDTAWTENTLGNEMTAEHRRTLDQLVQEGEITQAQADLIQEAYEAAVYHVWRVNIPLTCYTPVIVGYAPVSASDLVNQSEALSQIAAGTQIPPETLEKIQTALEHDPR